MITEMYANNDMIITCYSYHTPVSHRTSVNPHMKSKWVVTNFTKLLKQFSNQVTLIVKTISINSLLTVTMPKHAYCIEVS